MAVSQMESKPLPAETLTVNGRTKGRIGRRHRLERMVAPMGGARLVSAALGGMLATGLWIAMFTVGLSVPSQPFRDGLLAIAGGQPPAGAFPVNGAMDAMYALAIIAFCYTPTNLAMLCCLASLVGCLAYTATSQYVAPPKTREVLVLADASAEAKEDAKAATTEDMIPLRPTISAITWGFFIYLFIISGALLAVDNPFAATSPDQYLRLAGTASLLAFVVGWRPELLASLVTRVGATRIASQDDGKK